jgi:hypothetical protein
MPHAMDTNVWNLLQDEDKLLITAIVVSLPTQLDNLIFTGALQGADCTRWKVVSESLKQILIRNTSAGPEKPREKGRKAAKTPSTARLQTKDLVRLPTSKN